VDVVAQHAGQGVLDGVQPRSRDLAFIRLHEAHVEVRDRVALRPALDADQAHVRRRDGGVVEGEALYIGHGILLIVRCQDATRRRMRITGCQPRLAAECQPWKPSEGEYGASEMSRQAVQWHRNASTVQTWKISWNPKRPGQGFGFFIA